MHWVVVLELGIIDERIVADLHSMRATVVFPAQINACNAYTMCGIEKSRMNAFDEQNDCICEYGNGRFVRFQNSSQPTGLVDNSNILIK